MNNPNIMQCKDYNSGKIIYPVFAQVKMNGIFGRWDSHLKCFFTRSGNKIQGLSLLENEMSYFPMDFDGELVIPNMQFFKMNGLIRSFEETPNCMYYVFDAPTTVPCVATDLRLSIYTNVITNCPQRHVHPLKYFICYNETDLSKFYSKVLGAGHEGMVFKTIDAPYYNKKKWLVQKRVPESSTECPIIGFVEGQKGFTGMLGAFIVEFKGKAVKVGGGKGMTHSLRQQIWDNQDTYLHQIMKVSYKSITPAGSLQSPKYQGIRWDI